MASIPPFWGHCRRGYRGHPGQRAGGKRQAGAGAVQKGQPEISSDDTVIDLGNGPPSAGAVGHNRRPLLGGSEDQIADIAREVKGAGAAFSAGGAFKPRTSPTPSRACGRKDWSCCATPDKTGLPIVTEIMSPAHLVLFEDVDIIQVGARNMQNFELLKELGKCDKPILLKRGWPTPLKNCS